MATSIRARLVRWLWDPPTDLRVSALWLRQHAQGERVEYQGGRWTWPIPPSAPTPQPATKTAGTARRD